MARFEIKDRFLYIDDLKVIKAYESFNGWYWFVTEIADKQDSVIDGKIYKDDTIYFGFVQGSEEEWGYFSKKELELLRPRVWEVSDLDLPYSGRRNENSY